MSKLTITSDHIYMVIEGCSDYYEMVEDDCFDCNEDRMYEIIIKDLDTGKFYKVDYEHDYHSEYVCDEVAKYEKVITAWKVVD